MLVTAGAVGAPGVFIVPLEHEFGWNASEISSALAVRFVLYGLMGPFTAVLMNRFGVRRIVLAALVIIASTLLASLAMTQVWQLVLLWGIGVGIGTGLTAMVLAATVATRWFSERVAWWSECCRRARRPASLSSCPARQIDGALWVAAVSVLRLRDADARRHSGASVDAQSPVRHGPCSLWRDGNRSAADRDRRPGRTASFAILVLKDAAQNSAFWVLFATFFICGLSTNGLIQTHFIALCGDFGLAPVKAAGVLAMMGVFDFFGTIGSGWLSDRFDNRWLLFWYYGLRGLSLIYLPFTDFTFYGLSVFAMFYGLDWIATVPPTVQAHIAILRRRANQRRLRLDFRRPSARRCDSGLWRRTDAHALRDISARVLRSRSCLPRRRADRSVARKAREGEGDSTARAGLTQICMPEPQSIGDDAHGRQRHRGGGDDRRQQNAEDRIEHAGGDRDAGAL